MFSYILLGLFLGLFLGTNLGILLMALFKMAKRFDSA
jgi:Na+/H+ antiporter NhaA